MKSHMTSSPMVGEEPMKQVKGLVQLFCWQHPSPDSVEDRGEGGRREAGTLIR